MPDNNYNADKITVLEGLEGVRKRPGMYIGDTGKRGLHHMIWEILDNACDEALAGYCNKISITIGSQSVTIMDNGRGIPTDIHPVKQVSALEVVFTILHAGGKFDDKAYGGVTGGLHGVGASIVNALSSNLKVAVSHGTGEVYVQKYSKGKAKSAVKVINPKTKTPSGTKVEFTPDPEIFKEGTDFDMNIITKRVAEVSYLLPKVKFIVTDARGEKPVSETFSNTDGLKGFITDFILQGSQFALFKGDSKTVPSDTEEQKLLTTKRNIPSYQKSQDGFAIDFSLAYTNSYNERIFSFVNLVPTEGGTHVSGFRGALTKAVNNAGRKQGLIKDKQPNITGTELSEGLVAAISVYIKDPQFEGQTKGRLGNSEAEMLAGSAVYESLVNWFSLYPKELKTIIDKSLNARKARNAAKAAIDLVRKTTSKTTLSERLDIQSKLAGCTSRIPDQCELFLVEGDSAGGSAKQARDRRYQAILPLRGKVLNVQGVSHKQILGNQEIRDLIQVLGCGIYETCDTSKLRYNKIILMTDADVDGAHIAVLLLTFFFNLMPAVLSEGHVYMAQPPLYKFTYGGKESYLYSDAELQKKVSRYKNGTKNYSIQRYKGLGEMNPEQLRVTTMDKSARTLKRICIKDADGLAETFELLMGDNAQPRRDFIVEHSSESEAGLYV